MIHYKEDHRIMIHLPYKDAIGRLLIMYRKMLLDGYQVVIQPPMTSCSSIENGVVKEPDRLRVDFVNLDYTPKYALHMKNLVKYLSGFTDDIVYKQNLTGCKLSGECDVLEEWELDDGMC
jgi:hypothetical protein